MRTFTFSRGGHISRDMGMCVMEAAAYIAGEEHTDMPKCADYFISKVCQRLNDACSDKYRQEKLQELPWRVIGTNNKNFSKVRKQMIVDFIQNQFTWILNIEKGLDAYINIWIYMYDSKISKDEKCDMVLDLIDRMIKLTEIKEEVVQRQKEFV